MSIYQEQMSTKIKYRSARLEKLNWPYFCTKVGLSKGKNAMCFLSSSISVFPRKTTFLISRRDINLARLNQAENQPFSFDWHVASIERRKVVIQLIYCMTLSKKAQLQENWMNLIIYWGTKAECPPTFSSSVGQKDGHFDYVPYLGIPKDFRF